MAGCSVISTPEGEARQPVYCIFTPWKFHVSLIDLVSQLASQLQLTPSTTHDWQRLPPPPYAPHFFFFFLTRSSRQSHDLTCMGRARVCLWFPCMLACSFEMLVVMHAWTESWFHFRGSSASQGAGRGRDREGRKAERGGERGGWIWLQATDAQLTYSRN